ncbi:hypothetical protein KQI63_05815 [bacterium]|nr:hypothetical protein [bacterium]
MHAIADIIARAGEHLESESSRTPADWVRYPRIDRIRALLEAEAWIWNEVRRMLPRPSLETFAFEQARGYINTMPDQTVTEGYPSTVTLQGRQNVIALLQAAFNGFHCDIYTRQEYLAVAQDPTLGPSFARPAVVLTGNTIQVYPEGSTGTLELTALTSGLWYDRGNGGVSSPGGDVRELTDTSREWTADYWNGGTILVDESLYTITDGDDTGVTFTASGLATDTYSYNLLAEFADLSDTHARLLALATARELLADDSEAPGFDQVEKRTLQALVAFTGIPIEQPKGGRR